MEPAKMLANSIKLKPRKKFRFQNITNLHNLKIVEVFKYILELTKSLRLARRKLKKIKQKLKKPHSEIVVNVEDKFVQVNLDQQAALYENPKTLIKDSKSESSSPTQQRTSLDALNFVNEIKEAAENAQNMAGFVYEPTSGLYYDCKTGYYYNAEHGLYYDGNSGCYYKYDQVENKFEFHSQPQRQDADDELTTAANTLAPVEEKDVVKSVTKKNKSKFKEKKYTQTAADNFGHNSSKHHRRRRRRSDRHRSRSSHRNHRGNHRTAIRSSSPPQRQRSGQRRTRGPSLKRDPKKNHSYQRSISSRSSSSSSLLSSRECHKRKKNSDSSSVSSTSSSPRDKYKKIKSRKHHKTKKRFQNPRSRSNSKKRQKKPDRRSGGEETDAKEDGQISTDEESAATSSSPRSKDSSVIFIDETSVDVPQHYEDMAKIYPPALRIVVLATNVPKLNVGSLFVITYKGGSLGREGAHDVIIPDINISKYHLNFTYNQSKGCYECVDLGSRNGTILNGKRMSNSQQESEAKPILHGSQMQLSQTKLLFHIHDGHTTCAQCEPGLLVPQTAFYNGNLLEPLTCVDASTSSAAQLSHKQELKKLKKRYGLAEEKYVDRTNVGNNSVVDRAAQRRKEVGSSNQHEKTQVASVDLNIPTDNKGFKMLAKLGWTEGEKLGKNDQGLLEPIAMVSNVGTKGLGCGDAISSETSKKMVKKIEQMRITKERFNQNQQKEFPDIFINDESGSS